MHAVVGTTADGRKVGGHMRGNLQHPCTGMADDSARYLKEPPAHRSDPMPLPALSQGRALEQNEEIMGDDPQPEESRVGSLLSTRHPFHPEADFQLLDAVLGMFAPLVVPDQHIRSSRLRPPPVSINIKGRTCCTAV